MEEERTHAEYIHGELGSKELQIAIIYGVRKFDV